MFITRILRDEGAIWLSPCVCAAATGGVGDQQEEDPPDLQRVRVRFEMM